MRWFFLFVLVSESSYGLILPPELQQKSLVDRKLLPAVVPISDKAGVVGTGTFVGDGVILTTAHTKLKGRTLLFHHRNSLASFDLYPHPDAQFDKGRKGKDYDVALGLVTKPMIYKPDPLPIQGEMRIGDRVDLAGFGAIKRKTKCPDGRLHRSGFDVVNFVEPFFYVTTPEKGCASYGDSGGPVLAQDEGKTSVVGVISQAFNGDEVPYVGEVTYVVDLSSNEIRTFLKDFATAHKVSICGVNSDCVRPKPKSTWSWWFGN